MEEIWKDIEGFEGYYQVSNLGRVKRLARIMKNNLGKCQLKEIIKSPKKTKKGYLNLALTKDNKIVHTSIHRIVATAFIPKKENCNIVNHLNGIKDDNRVENLEWTNASGNVRHALNNNLIIPRKGNEIHFSVYNQQIVKIIRYLYDNSILSLSEIAKKLNQRRRNISTITNRESWVGVECGVDEIYTVKDLDDVSSLFIKRKTVSTLINKNVHKMKESDLDLLITILENKFDNELTKM